MGGLNRVRGLNERMPLHKEIDVSMCNGILRIWLGHFGSSAHLIGDRMVSFETIRSQGVGGDPRQTPEIEWFQLKPFDLGCPKLDPQDRMVSIETIRYPWIFLKPFDLPPPTPHETLRSNGFKKIQGYRMVSIETIRSGGSNFGHPRSNGFS